MNAEGERAETRVGADVRRRLVATNMLLARRERQHIAAASVGVDGLAAEAPGHLPQIGLRASRTGRHRARRRRADCRSTGPRRRRYRRPSRRAASRRPSETASVKTAISSAPCAWQASAIGVRSRRLPNTSGVCTMTQETLSSIAATMSSRARTSGASVDDLVAGEMRDRAHDLRIMRMQPAREHGLAPLGDAMRHQRRLGAGGRAVIHGGVGDLHAGEHGDLRLELEQILQRALRYLRLIGRVAGQELRALDQMIDARRNVMLIGAGADEEGRARGRDIALRHSAEQTRSTSISDFAARQIERRRRAAAPRAHRRRERRHRATPIAARICARSLARVKGR